MIQVQAVQDDTSSGSLEWYKFTFLAVQDETSSGGIDKQIINVFWQKCLLVQVRVGHSVLFRSVGYVLLRSKKRKLRSLPFFSRVFGDLWDPKERREHNVLLQRMEKNGKNALFFCKEQKRT